MVYSEGGKGGRVKKGGRREGGQRRKKGGRRVERKERRIFDL